LTFAIMAALRSHPDIVICVELALFCAPAALSAAKLFGAKSVLHVQDLEVDAAFGIGFLKGLCSAGWSQRLSVSC